MQKYDEELDAFESQQMEISPIDYKKITIHLDRGCKLPILIQGINGVDEIEIILK